MLYGQSYIKPSISRSNCGYILSARSKNLSDKQGLQYALQVHGLATTDRYWAGRIVRSVGGGVRRSAACQERLAAVVQLIGRPDILVFKIR